MKYIRILVWFYKRFRTFGIMASKIAAKNPILKDIYKLQYTW